MPSSYTTSLRLVLPVTGELTGTWGDVVNNGLTELVEAAIAGTAAVTMTDANYTLSTANEAADEARCMFIALGGGALTATRDVICPSVSKLYVVLNNTTGGQSIRFKTLAGTGITLANGQRALLYCDGTNVTNAIGLPPLSGTGSNASVLASLGALAADTQARTGASSVAEADRGAVLFCTNSFTLSLTAAATLGDGFSFGLVNVGTGSVTIDPNGAETIDGASTLSLSEGQSCLVVTDGSSWRTIGRGQLTPATATTIGAVLTPRGYIAGLTMSTAGSSSTMSVAAGQATDSTHAYLMSLASAISKTTSAWAVGTGNGGLDTGAIANNTWYHFHLIRRPDTGVVDVLVSLSATAPTLPANYTQFRRIGSGRTNGSSQWLKFVQFGDLFTWDTLSALDLSATTSTTAALQVVTVPTGVKVEAYLNVNTDNTNAGSNHYFSDPDTTSAAASISAWPLGQVGAPINSGGGRTQVRCVTNTSAQVRHVDTRNDGNIYIATIGWRDLRGRDA